MTAPFETAERPASAAAPFIEKAPLERYVVPEKPSLVGMSRAALVETLGEALQRSRQLAQVANQPVGLG